MKQSYYRIAFVLDILLLLLIGLLVADRWAHRSGDWLSLILPTIYYGLILELVLFLLVFSIVKTPRIEISVKTTVMFALFVMGLCLGVVFGFYNPNFNNSEKGETAVADLGMDEAEYATLAPCDQVKTYVDVASVSVNLDTRVDFAPYWMHKPLMDLPKDTLAVCMAEEMRKNTALVASSKTFNEEAVRKIYVLLFEADRLQVYRQPDFDSAVKEAACTPNADPYGDLVVYYYSISIFTPGPRPEFEGYSTKEIADIVRPEICGK
ncbi:MAG: hypothetical protein AB1750_07170 [Chloroflexota bacterium]